MTNPTEPAQTPYDGIIPTGWLTAYGRTFADIPHAQEVFDGLEALQHERGPSPHLEEMKDTNLAPQFEARYKLMDRLIKEAGVGQVLEVAAGLSTRGLSLTADRSITYVEVDLPAMMADKRTIFDRLQDSKKIPERSNLFLEDGSATDLASLQAAARHFDPDKPVAVVNEGLLRYLTFDDKAAYIDNVKALLREFGGSWITSDISLPKVKRIEDGFMQKRRDWISSVTGRDVTKNFFKDVDEARAFFEKRGLAVEDHNFLEVSDQLVSPGKLKIPSDEARTLIGSALFFVMRLDQN